MHVLLDEVGARPLVHVTQSGRLEGSVELRRELLPLQRIRIGRSARAVEKAPQSQIDEVEAHGIRGKSELIRPAFTVVGYCQVFWQTDIVRGEVGEEWCHIGGHVGIRRANRRAAQMALIATSLA